jgi:hypothetical protein
MSTNIRTPHAAIIIWNYVDRIGLDGVKKEIETEPKIISTLSCISINTNKSKSDPQGTFNITLAPLKNWVSTITPGSWCCILMSNEPITKKDLDKANRKHIKMIGKIESVRVSTQQVGDTRQTTYSVSGVDWGHIFNSILYVDNLIASANDPQLQGNSAAVALRRAMTGDNSSPQSFAVRDNMASILTVFGSKLGGFTDIEKDINRIAKPIYDFIMPKEMVSYFGFKNNKVNNNIKLITGSLTGYDKYNDAVEAVGFIDPFSLQGTNSLWEILLENSNPALNEMFCDLKWDNGDTPTLALYNRIRPFSTKNFKPKRATGELRSFFQNIKTHELDNISIIGINAGTNWRDKYNFVEIKPMFQDHAIFGNMVKQKTQDFDEDAFSREGFRPLIVGTKQFPNRDSSKSLADVDYAKLVKWTELLKEWHFDTHRMLNGTINMVGSSKYIGIGDNIMFDAGIINPTPNINNSSMKKQKNYYIMAHVENISHSFSVNPNGSRTYMTTIQFVRGIIVNKDGTLVGEGILDKYAGGDEKNSNTPSQDRNRSNTISTSVDNDVDNEDKVKGT